MLAVGAEHRRPHLEHDVRLRPEVGGGHDARADLGVARVLHVRAFARAGLDEDLDAELEDLLDRLRCRRDALLLRLHLFGDSDLQGGPTLSERLVRWQRSTQLTPSPRDLPIFAAFRVGPARA